MIVRVSEALVNPGAEEDFLRRLQELVAGFPGRYEGLVGHEVLVDRADSRRVLYISRWRDERALAEYAGPGWASHPVTFPGEDVLLSQPLTLRHFTALPPET